MISTLKQRINTKEKAHIKLHPGDPTKYREEASNHGYLILRMMLMYGRAYPTIIMKLLCAEFMCSNKNKVTIESGNVKGMSKIKRILLQ